MINYKLRFLLFFLSLFIFAGCETHKNNIYESPKKQTYLPYSDLARISHLSLAHDGYIIGIEKRKRTEKEIENPPKAKNKRNGFSIITSQNDRCSITEKEKKRFKRNVQKRDEKFVDYISDSSIMCVSHIASYFEEGNNEDYNRFRRPVFLYNAYDEYKQDKLDYEEGYKTLGDFEKDLKLKLKGKLEKKENYTHIILFCMGWNNNQQESIYRYNKIVTNLKNIAPEKDFKPLVIGLCWPSSWLTIENSLLKKYLFFFASYFTKQDDADEVGMTIANLIIHNIVLKVKAEIKDEINKEGKNVKLPKIIAIGHSMGARILSRAIFSDGYLVPKYEGDIEVDLFIGLQGAFSANRFVAFDGWEGSPYAELCNRETVFSLTTSGNDKANPIAAKITGAKHTGGRHGLRIAKKRKNSNIFEEVVTWSKTNMQSNLDELDSIKDDREQRNEKKVIMIDVTSILEKDKNRYPDPKDAHNDILDAGMAELIWALIQNFANYSNKK